MKSKVRGLRSNRPSWLLGVNDAISTDQIGRNSSVNDSLLKYERMT